MGKEILYLPVMSDITLAGARNEEFLPRNMILLEKENSKSSTSSLNRTEKACRASADNDYII